MATVKRRESAAAPIVQGAGPLAALGLVFVDAAGRALPVPEACEYTGRPCEFWQPPVPGTCLSQDPADCQAERSGG